MKILKKIFGPKVATPKPAPCGHIPPIFPTKTGTHVTITIMPQEFGQYTISGSVWCGDGCGWVDVSDEDYAYFRGFNGNEPS